MVLLVQTPTGSMKSDGRPVISGPFSPVRFRSTVPSYFFDDRENTISSVSCAHTSPATTLERPVLANMSTSSTTPRPTRRRSSAISIATADSVASTSSLISSSSASTASEVDEDKEEDEGERRTSIASSITTVDFEITSGKQKYEYDLSGRAVRILKEGMYEGLVSSPSNSHFSWSAEINDEEVVGKEADKQEGSIEDLICDKVKVQVPIRHRSDMLSNDQNDNKDNAIDDSEDEPLIQTLTTSQLLELWAADSSRRARQCSNTSNTKKTYDLKIREAISDESQRKVWVYSEVFVMEPIVTGAGEDKDEADDDEDDAMMMIATKERVDMLSFDWEGKLCEVVGWDRRRSSVVEKGRGRRRTRQNSRA